MYLAPQEFRDAMNRLPKDYDEVDESGTPAAVRSKYREFILL